MTYPWIRYPPDSERLVADQEIRDPIPAATVVLLRSRSTAVETLMLRKSADIDFGGMWVFPGGCIEDVDYDDSLDTETAARAAAARETEEETGIRVEPGEFQWFSHWTPPPMPRKRFQTWFFAAAVDGYDRVEVDGDEIQAYQWIRPYHALDQHQQGRINMVAPTWLTLYYLSRYPSVPALLHRFATTAPKHYQSRPARGQAGTHIVLWHGDAGYETWDASLPGERHRLIVEGNRYTFENTIEQY